MYEKRIEEREIDLLDLLWNLVEQWRAIIIVGLIFAMLVPLGVGVRTTIAGSGIATESTEDLDNQYQSMLFALNVYMQYRSYEDEYNDIILNHSDEKLSDMTNRYNDLRDAYDNACIVLDTGNQELLSAIIKTITKEDIKSGNIDGVRATLDELWDKKVEAATNVSTPTIADRFNKKTMSIGFVAGIFVYAMAFAMIVVFRKTITNPADVEGLMGVRHYGNIYKYPYKGALARFAHHKAFYNKRKKSAGASKLAEDLATKIEFIGEKKVTFISLGETDADTNAVIDEQISLLKSYGVDAGSLNIVGDVSDLKDSDYLNLGLVFVQVISGKTTFTSLLDLRDKLNEYDVKIVGTEFIEV